jgi:hypothetical protein
VVGVVVGKLDVHAAVQKGKKQLHKWRVRLNLKRRRARGENIVSSK